jgi:hypothetical protein
LSDNSREYRDLASKFQAQNIEGLENDPRFFFIEECSKRYQPKGSLEGNFSDTLEYDRDFFTEIYMYNQDHFINKKFIYIEDSNISFHVNKFLRKTYTYSKYGDYLEVIRRCLTEGPSFAKELKKEFQYRFLDTFSARKTNRKVLRNYYDIFPERHLINWKEPDSEDYKYMEEFLETDPDTLDMYECSLRDILEDIEVHPINDLHLKSMGGSSTICEPEKFRGYKKIQSQQVNYSRVMKGRRSVIQVGPANVRDTVILTEDSVNTVQLISLLCRQIVNKLKASAMRTGQGANDRLDRHNKLLYKEGYVCYVRDFKKSGLTMPHKVLESTIRVLNEKYPGVGFNFGSCLYNLEIVQSDTGSLIDVKRGHGLGMANELTTLIQCAVDNLVRLEYFSEFTKIKTDSFNDDFRAIGPIDMMRIYKEKDISTCTKLGFLLNLEKTDILYGASVFLEEYVVTDNSYDYSKEILTDMTIDNAFHAYNITHAKSLIRPISYELWAQDSDLLNKISQVIQYWGYEFYSKECQFSSEMGGWIDLPFYGRYQAMRGNYLEFAIPECNNAAVEAEQSGVTIELHPKYSPYKYLRRDLREVKIDNITRSLCPHSDIITWNERAIARQVWSAISMRQNPSTYWYKLYEERIKNYYKHKNIYMPTVIEIFNKIVKYNPTKTYIIPKFLIKSEVYGGYIEEVCRKYYDPFEVFSNINPYKWIDLETQFIKYRDKMSISDKLELIYQSGIVEGFENVEVYTSSFNNIDEKLKNYDFLPLMRNAAYLARDDALPEKLLDGIELPNRLDELDISDEIDLIQRYDITRPDMPREFMKNYEYIINKYEVDRLEAYNLLNKIKEAITDKNAIIKIDPNARSFISSIVIENKLNNYRKIDRKEDEVLLEELDDDPLLSEFHSETDYLKDEIIDIENLCLNEEDVLYYDNENLEDTDYYNLNSDTEDLHQEYEEYGE